VVGEAPNFSFDFQRGPASKKKKKKKKAALKASSLKTLDRLDNFGRVKTSNVRGSIFRSRWGAPPERRWPPQSPE